MTKLVATYTALFAIFVGQAYGLTFGNPAAMPPKGGFEAAADYNQSHLYTQNSTYENDFTTHQFYVRMGYAPFKSLEFFGLVGGADLDWKWTHKTTMNRYYLDGSWELSAGGGLRVKTPWEFDAIGFKWHSFGQASLVLHKSHYPTMEFSRELSLKSTVKIQRYDAAAILAAYSRKFAITFYGGLNFRYLDARANYVATTTSTGVSTRGDFLLGASTGNDNPLTFLVTPVLGLNWHLTQSTALDLELEWVNFDNGQPVFGLSAGFSQYK